MTTLSTPDLTSHWSEIEAVTNEARPHEVFEVLARNPDWPFVPVIDHSGRPVGVVRERRLKGFAYSRFGRELIQRRSLDEFVEPSATVPADISLDELLMQGSNNPNPDGILIAENGRYRAVLLNSALLRLHEQHHIETRVRLVNAEKMEAIGTLAGGIAHDLNNMLMPILGYAELLREMVRGGQPADSGMIDQIIISATRGRQTVKQILAFSRHQELKRCEMRLSDIVKEVLRLAGTSLTSTVEIEMSIDTDNDMVLASPSEMHQVLLNFCTNAHYAMRDKGGRLRVSLTDHHGPLLGWSLHAGNLPNRLVRLSVADSGTGIDEALLPRIFEPFFTTKPQGDGTGMGLAIAHGIIVRCGGMISVESEPGQGSVFHLYLPPILGRTAETGPAGRPAAAAPGHLFANDPSIRVLVVDDETPIARLARDVLSRYRLDVKTETDSTQAWEHFKADPDSVDVLITDQMMPGMKGTELAEKILTIRPDLPIILCTGYAEAAAPERLQALGIREYRLKPLDFTQLAVLIRGWFPSSGRPAAAGPHAPATPACRI